MLALWERLQASALYCRLFSPFNKLGVVGRMLWFFLLLPVFFFVVFIFTPTLWVIGVLVDCIKQSGR